MRLVTVGKNEAGQRLDKMLSKYLNLAGKGFLYKMMRKKNIVLNGKKCDGSEYLKEGDQIKLFLADETIEKFSKITIQKVQKRPLSIIYEDEHLLLLNKPAGMLSQKAREQDESMVEYVIDYLLESGQLTKENLRAFRPSVCNRLDRNTSGLIVAGKTLAGLQIMSKVFKNRSIHKKYRCIVGGTIREKQVITGFLTKDEDDNRVTIHKKELPGSSAILTEYMPISDNGIYTYLEVTLITGRTHQIRAHLAAIGHPIAGDPKYGDEKLNKLLRNQYHIKSQLLHSWQLELPQLPEPLDYLSGRLFAAPVPEKFRNLLIQEGL